MEEISLDNVKKIEVDILKYIDEVCKKNNIEYFLYGGSLIGSVRHEGFIPWDDDIDIALLRNDYDKLVEVLKNEKNKKFLFMDNSTNENYYYPFAKVIDARTYMKENNMQEIPNYGIYVDILVIDKITSNRFKQKRIFNKRKKFQRLSIYYAMEKIEEKNLIKKIIKYYYKYKAKIIGIDRVIKNYNDFAHKQNRKNENSKNCVCNWTSYTFKYEIQKKSNFEEFIDGKFEDLNIRIPKDYDSILTTIYGNYMELPPIEKRIPRHDSIRKWK